MNVWSKFFCAACQCERPISERVKVRGNLSRCRGCAYKTRFVEAAKREPVDYETYESQTIPDDVMEAYREAQE